MKCGNAPEEGKALKFKEEATDTWRDEHDIPGTESLPEMMEMKKRGRSDTDSTAYSDSHDPKFA